ncbi:MAG: hypothetical protein K8H86_04820 [Ignavibacteriaceae bacterium]|nr:hypothetical protein [Ignavibacteriaceae bacterium]
MRLKCLTFLLLILTISVFAQTNIPRDSTKIEKEKELRSYIFGGYGRTINDNNWAVGFGLFFPLSKSVLVGPEQILISKWMPFRLKIHQNTFGMWT